MIKKSVNAISLYRERLCVQVENDTFVGTVSAARVVGILLLLAGLLQVVDDVVQRRGVKLLCCLDGLLEVFDALGLNGVVFVLVSLQGFVIVSHDAFCSFVAAL